MITVQDFEHMDLEDIKNWIKENLRTPDLIINTYKKPLSKAATFRFRLAIRELSKLPEDQLGVGTTNELSQLLKIIT